MADMPHHHHHHHL
jgi:hypothetical protein